MEIKDWLVPVLTIAGSFGGAYYAATLALARFTKEKIWERKAAAYTIIFEALHHMKTRLEALREDAQIPGSLPNDNKEELFKKSKASYQTLRSRLDSEIWLIPTPIRQRLEKFLYDVDNKTAMNEWDLYVYLAHSANQVIVDVRALARCDLNLDK